MRALWRKLDQKVDWISCWDHFYEAPPAGGTIDHFEAMATLGALAAETQHARIGCLVFYVGYRNPARIAKAAATLDHISGDRFIYQGDYGGQPWPRVMESLELYAAEVLPEVAKLGAA